MDKLRLINIFLVTLVITLAIQLWVFPQKNVVTQTQGVYLSVASDDIVVPNIPKVVVHNTTSGALTINPCDDMTIAVDSVPLTGFRESTPDFCHPMVVNAGTNTGINMTPLYRVFANQTGKYLVTLKSEIGDRTVAFGVSQPGIFRSLLSRVVYEPIYNLFVALLTWVTGHSLGWAIVIITLIIRLILLVPQQHMLESQKKMQIIQPKIKALQKEYKDDQAQLGMKMMELYKKEGVNPAGSCLPLLIQMPILIGLYWVISGITDPSNFYHLYGVFKDFNPASINTNFYGINLAQVGGTMAIVFALTLAVTQWIQAYMSFHYTNKGKKVVSHPVDTQNENPALNPELMQKMMLYMLPVMIGVSALFFPLGVGLYWFIGTLFVIAQQWYVNSKSEKKAKQGEIVRK